MVKHQVISREDIAVLFPPLCKNAHKGSMGRVLCICGSYEPCGASMCGAAYLSAAAAYRTGAGIAEIFTARKNYEALGALVPEAVFSLYDTERESGGDICARLCEEIKKADSIVLGCGLGQSDTAHALVKAVLENANAPLVIDADGLNIISCEPDLLSLLSAEQRARTVITPHPGEMARLMGLSVSNVLSDIRGTAEKFATEHGMLTLLKDHHTVITDGENTFVNQSGGPGMATGGSGDVLSGIIGALLARDTLAEWADCRLADSQAAQNDPKCAAEDNRSEAENTDSSCRKAFAEPFSKSGRISPVLYRAAAAAYIHGLAGDRAAEKFGEYSMTARDILSEIATVLTNCSYEK